MQWVGDVVINTKQSCDQQLGFGRGGGVCGKHIGSLMLTFDIILFSS